MNLKALIEKRNAKIGELEKLTEKVSAETRAFSEDEQKQFDTLKSEIEALTETIKSVQESINLSTDKDDSKATEEPSESETRAFANYIRDIETRSDTNITTTANGAVIPKSIANKIIEKVKDISPLYQFATKYNVKGTLSIPYYDETTTAMEMAYATEFTDLESTAGKFLSIDLNGFLAGVLTKISKSIINNSDFDIVGFIVERMAKAIAEWLEKELINGTSGKITGLSGVTQSVTTASATAITADELIDLQETVPDVYQNNACWIMSKTTRTKIRKLKDSDGNYILNKDATARWGYTLFGKDVYVSENMPAVASGKTSIYYGDFSGLAVKISEDMNIEVLREKFATQHAIGVVGWIEVDSKVENAQKVSKLVQKGS